MRILVVLNNADRYLTVWETVANLGIDVHIVAPNETAQRLSDRPGLTVHGVKDRFLRSGRETWRYLPGLRKLVRITDPDLIHMTTEPWSIAALQALSTRRPTIIHGAEILFRSGTEFEILIRSVLCRINLPRSAGYVGWNSMSVETALAEGLPRRTPTLVAPAEVPFPGPYNDARTRRPAFRAQMGWAEEDFVTGFVGRYSPEKGLSWLLDSFQATHNPKLRLDCFGAGDDASLIDAAIGRSTRRIVDHGTTPFETIPALMSSIDALVIPSVMTEGCLEQFGRVAIEAMLAGTPIISSDAGALPEVVGDAGILVPQADTKSLTQAIDGLSLDSDHQEELAKLGRARAQAHFAPTVIAERLIAFWIDILRSTPHRSLRNPWRPMRSDAMSSPIALPVASPGTIPRSRPVVAVLMASHNREATTVRCLETVRAQRAEGAQLEIFLVDDASTDGTAASVAENFPDVHLIAGGGALFWSGAMRLAQTAARKIDPDFLVWLNDDVVLDDDAITRLLAAHRDVIEAGGEGIVVGGLTDPETGAISYAGVNRPDHRRPTRFEIVEPTERLQTCDSMHGNLVLIPELVFRRLDGFDSSFRHAMSDFDFGLRVAQQGLGVWLAPGTFGSCPRDHSDAPWAARDLGVIGRTKMLLSPKGLPPGDWLRFTSRHAGRFWPVFFASPYVRFAGQILRGK